MSEEIDKNADKVIQECTEEMLKIDLELEFQRSEWFKLCQDRFIARGSIMKLYCYTCYYGYMEAYSCVECAFNHEIQANYCPACYQYGNNCFDCPVYDDCPGHSI